jgi:acetyltransferase-like isoleucine patch superfamily enzyme
MGLVNKVKSGLKPLKKLLYKQNVKFGSYEFAIGKGTIVDVDSSSLVKFVSKVMIECYVIIRANDHSVIEIGEDVFIGDYSTIRATRNATIIIGADTMIAQGVKIISTNHAFMDRHQLIRNQDVIEDKKNIKIGNDCWVGAGSIILPGVTVGNGVVIGANSVVTKDLPDYAVAVGNPAKILKYRE